MRRWTAKPLPRRTRHRRDPSPRSWLTPSILCTTTLLPGVGPGHLRPEAGHLQANYVVITPNSLHSARAVVPLRPPSGRVRLRSSAAGCLLAPSVEGALNIQKMCYPCARSKTSPIFPLAHKTPTNSLTPTRPATRGAALRAARNYPTSSSYGNLCDLTALADHPGLRFPRICAEVVPVMWAVAIRLDLNRIRMGRDALIARLLADGIETRPGFYPASAQPPFAGPPVGNSERLASQIISLPASPTLAEEEVDQVCTRLLALASP
jgi:hypothetical protein